MQKITPFLWFDDQAEEAMRFYVGIFPNSRELGVSRYGEGAPRPKGSVMTASFELDGQTFTALNGGPQFRFTPAISFVVTCESQAEIDRLWAALTAGGKPGRCGWLEDKFGVSWQIVPAGLGALIAHPRAMQAMLTMDKLDIEALRRAAAS